MGGIDSCSIISNLTQLFSISTRIRERPGDIIVKDVKGTSPLGPRLLKPKVSNKSLLRIEKLTLI